MATDINNETLIARYLLGELPEDQQVEIEDRAFADKDYLAGITAVENDLIDEYVRGELSAADRQRFEARFLRSAERRKRVEFATALRTVVYESPVPEKKLIQEVPGWSWRDSLYAFLNGLNPAARLAFVAATILLIVGLRGCSLKRCVCDVRSTSYRQRNSQDKAYNKRSTRSANVMRN